MHSDSPFKRLRTLVSTAIFAGLCLTLLVGVSPNLSSKLVSIGELIWPGYAKDLRQDLAPPECVVEQLKSRLDGCVPQSELQAAEPKNAAEDPFAEDPFAEDPFAEDPFADTPPEQSKGAAPSSVAPDPFAGADPFADEGDEKEVSDEDPFAEDPFAEDPLSTAPETKGSSTKLSTGSCAAIEALITRCETRHAAYSENQQRLTDSVRLYRKLEATLGSLAAFSYWKHLLIVLTILGTLCATALRAHISLRNARTRLEERVSQSFQLLVHLAWALSCFRDYQIQSQSVAEANALGLPLLWLVGFALLSGFNIFHLIRARRMPVQKNSPGRLLMVIPLYAYMGVIAIGYFSFVEGHGSGQAIYLHKFIQHPTIYLGIGLYIWAGMLFASTRIARVFFGMLTPWGLPIGILAWLTVVLAALPTAYSGASGIFVIAAGAVIFEQLMAAGASKRIALAATAMSGSLGVVLRPCLVVVLIAVLNKQVTTDELFSKGFWVFLLTAVLLLIAFMVRERDGLTINPRPDARALVKKALSELIPYFMLAVIVGAFYGLMLDTWLNEHTAPLILPGVLLVLVIYERRRVRPALPDEADQRLLWPTLVDATRESATHIGALLIVMAASVGLGGVVERAELMSLFPDDFGGPIWAMSALVVMMVLVGMTMDALGAVVLVSVTLAKVAYDNGIDPTHFWMMVLVAFELGYLTPPVALNHLLARQVIGEDAVLDDETELGFWARNEHLWLPMLVMGIALIIVAYVPFMWYES